MKPAKLLPEQLRALCHEMDAELRLLVAELSAGNLNEQDFVKALLRMESEKARAHGLVLNASHTFDDWTVISLCACGAEVACASFEFDPASGRFRQVGTPCREPDPRTAAPTGGTRPRT